MKNFLITYNGAATRFKGTSYIEMAATPYDALFSYFSKFLDGDFFPQEDGTILNCNRNHVADNGDSQFSYDGGYFVATPLADVLYEKISLHFANTLQYDSGDIDEIIENINVVHIYAKKVREIVEELQSKVDELAHEESDGISMSNINKISQLEMDASMKIANLYE